MSRQGRHGEWKFGAICTAPDAGAEAVVNKASDDQHGWDHILEIVPPNLCQLPADLKTHVMQCFAQIKTTNGTSPKTKLKLSNAVKAAKSPLPSFVFLLQYSNGSSTPRIFGRHVWRNEIAHWLKRARETEHTGRKDLYNLTVSMSFGDFDILDRNPVDWVLSVLSKYGGEQYAAKKLSLVDSVGYEQFSHEGTVTFGPLTSSDDVILHELGLIEDLPISDYRIFDTRFGIKSASPVSTFSTGRMSFASEGRPVSLRLVSRNSASISLPSTMRIPTVVEPSDINFRTRIKSGNIDIVLAKLERNKDIRLNYDLNEKLPLIQQVGFLCLVNWSQEGAVEFSVSDDWGPLIEGKFESAFKQEKWMLEAEKIGHHLVSMLGKGNCEQLEVSYRDFEKLDKTVFFASTVLSAPSLCIEGEFGHDIEPFEKAIGYYAGQVGEWSYSAIWQMPHKALNMGDGVCSLYFSRPEIVWSQAFKQPLDVLQVQTLAEFELYKKRQVKPVVTFHEGDLVALAQAIFEDVPIRIKIDKPESMSGGK